MAKLTKTAMLCGSIVIASCAATSQAVTQDSNTAPSTQSANAEANTVYKVGGDVSAPVLMHSVDPEAANVSGNVQVVLWVDIHGNPSHIHVTHGLGSGLDEKAIMAVHQYRYKPALKNGQPVRVEIKVDVRFP
jgi:TonB family protein